MVELQGTVTRVGGLIPVSWSSAKMDRAKNLFQCQTHTLILIKFNSFVFHVAANESVNRLSNRVKNFILPAKLLQNLKIGVVALSVHILVSVG